MTPTAFSLSTCPFLTFVSSSLTWPPVSSRGEYQLHAREHLGRLLLQKYREKQSGDPAANAFVLLEDDGHVVERGPRCLEGRLADPVLVAMPHVVDSDLGGGYAGQGHRVLAVGVTDLRAVPGGPDSARVGLPVVLDPDLDRMPRRQRGVDRRGRIAFAADGVRQPVAPGKIDDHRVVHAVPSRDRRDTVDVADEVRVGIAPLPNGVIWSHDRRPEIDRLSRKQLGVRVVVAVVGERDAKGARLAVQIHRLLVYRRSDGDHVLGWRWRRCPRKLGKSARTGIED